MQEEPGQNLANPLDAVATDAEVAIIKCVNPDKAIQYGKTLKHIVEVSIKLFRRGLNAEPEEMMLDEVMGCLIKEFRDLVKTVHDPVKCANRKGVWECTTDAEAK